MTKAKLLRLISGDEDSTVEFKRDDIENYKLAKELVAFLNLEGGTVLLGVEKDGSISGVTRDRIQEWIGNLCRDKIEPPITPLLSWARDAAPGRDVLAVHVAAGPDKPYARVHHGRKTYYIRVGDTSREVSREELERMFQASRRLHYGLKPVPGAGLDAFDGRRIRDYFKRVRGGTLPEDEDSTGWETLLKNTKLMTVAAGHHTATIDGILLFGKHPISTCPSPASGPCVTMARSRTMPPAPTPTYEVPWCLWVLRPRESDSADWWSRLGISSAAIRSPAHAWKVEDGSTVGSTPKR